MRLTTILAALAVAGVAMAGGAQAPPAATDAERLEAARQKSVQGVRDGRYLDASFGLLAGLGLAAATDIKDPDVFDQWAQVMSCMTGTPTFNPAKAADFHVPESQVADLRAADGVAAIPEIVRRARLTRIVILDENHLDPRGRAFGLEVARALRPLGYTVLAAEALKRGADDTAMRAQSDKHTADGYVRRSSGYYLDDPVFADFLRQSLAMGYRLVSYETGGDNLLSPPRDQDQADILVRRALKAHPGAKILIYSGEHHLAERPIAVEGGKQAWMAQMLKEATGIDPLTIDQAGLSPLPLNRPDVDLYALAAHKARGRSVVLMHRGAPLSVGLLAGSIDLQVVHPRSGTVGGRPAWLAGMDRTARPIPRDLLPKAGTRLVQAFVATEADDAIPIDQVLVTAGAKPPVLMLPRVAVRYAVQDLPAGATSRPPPS